MFQIIGTHINDTAIFDDKADILSPLSFPFNSIGNFAVYTLHVHIQGYKPAIIKYFSRVTK